MLVWYFPKQGAAEGQFFLVSNFAATPLDTKSGQDLQNVYGKAGTISEVGLAAIRAHIASNLSALGR